MFPSFLLELYPGTKVLWSWKCRIIETPHAKPAQIGTATALKEDTKRRKENGEDDLADITVKILVSSLNKVKYDFIGE
ncbi:MAG: hypothetical protein M1824_005424 [Vezdaea acicularis]|nr:MAG: hypothetical protein M1824_005424 [Vezdaea acicularis]